MEEDKKQKYEDYINQSSPMAAVIGRRVPYHLEYIRKHGTGPVPEGLITRENLQEDAEN